MTEWCGKPDIARPKIECGAAEIILSVVRPYASLKHFGFSSVSWFYNIINF